MSSDTSFKGLTQLIPKYYQQCKTTIKKVHIHQWDGYIVKTRRKEEDEQEEEEGAREKKNSEEQKGKLNLGALSLYS